jgi:hypothetical protein
MGLIELILDTSRNADNFHQTRSLYSVLAATQSELGELSEEVAIESGDSYKDHGPDGIQGEAVDMLIAGLDLLYVNLLLSQGPSWKSGSPSSCKLTEKERSSEDFDFASNFRVIDHLPTNEPVGGVKLAV